MKKIFVVDDDANIRELIKLYLEKESYDVEVFEGGEAVIKRIKNSIPDLVLLDLMMPGIDGYDTLKEIKKIADIPFIMVTAKDETMDKIIGLELGADDYIAKPFDGKELVARVKAVLRRSKATEQPDHGLKVEFDNLSINLDNYVVTYYGKDFELPPKEIELLHYLASNPDRVFTREQLLDKIWGYDFFGETRTVDVHIKRLREKFDNTDDKWEIKTVWGVGYKFKIDKK
ncbi:MAG: response regulator transcription factor [Bacillota bacterium]|nr:response regulator transcription factor [Bacillota bacterium]